MTKLNNLIVKRSSLKSRLAIFSTFLSNLETTYPDKIIKETHVLLELEQRMQLLFDLKAEFDEVQLQIDYLRQNNADPNAAAEAADSDFTERASFEGAFFSATSRSKAILNVNTNDETASVGEQEADYARSEVSSRHHTFGQQSFVKLPTIQLPTFGGEYEAWLEYRDIFDSLIHQNETISDIQKFHYLRSSLSHGALQIISSLEFTTTNYQVAWQLINERYNNSRILIQNHVKSLFNMEKIVEESSKLLRKIIDSVHKHLRALKSLNEPTENWDTLIIYIVSTKLDSSTAREWEEAKASHQTPTLKNLTDFLKDRADLLESLEQNQACRRQSVKPKQEFKPKSFLSTKITCAFCRGDHYAQNCSDFLKLNVSDRIAHAKSSRLCLNCLRPGHMVKQCKSSSCKQCNSRHNSLLHIATAPHSNPTTGSSAVPSPGPVLRHDQVTQSPSVNCSAISDSCGTQVLLSTCLIEVFDNNNQVHKVRALLDPGSQSSFITKELCNSLRLPQTPINIKVNGISQSQSNIKSKTNIHVRSCHNNFSTRIGCLVLSQITSDLPNFRVSRNQLQIPENIKLADPTFHLPGKVDILIGADCFWSLLCVGQLKASNNGAILQKSKFGWIISGPINNNESQAVQCHFSQLDQQLTRFWEIEEFANVKPLSREEKSCEAHFTETTRRAENGQFIVTIPMRQDPECLGESFETARRRLLSLERKFEHNADFKDQYVQFMNEYRDLGHMSKVAPDDNSANAYYIPHHGVIKESSLTTKLRVVFDASCPTSSGYSLNDLQMVGPTIQADLFEALVRHRGYKYVIGGDVEKMYRMCLVDECQRRLQRILWRDNVDAPIDVYELNTVTYGTSAASYLAIRCLFQIGLECQSPQIANVIKNHFYVDDLLTGGNTVAEVVHIAKAVSHELHRAGFSLRKWASNCPQILEALGFDSKAMTVINLGHCENTKTLGLVWNPNSDSLMYEISQTSAKRATKRIILSEISQVFDPLGLLSPCTILAKILLQELWSEGLSWDESLPSSLHYSWLRFRDELPLLNELRIPRHITCSDPVQIELHGFSDASTRAYGACVYVRSRNHNGDVSVNLVAAKSKVAPLKQQTIPRLELSAALLLARLICKVKSSLELNIERMVCWCDSTIVLGWLRMPPNSLQVFVANRVVAIEELTHGESWRHVPTSDNPADHISRGVNPEQLRNLEIYWHGPSWIKQDEISWPSGLVTNENDILPELRKTQSHNAIVSDAFDFNRYSTLARLERITAYCLRFKSNALGPIRSRKTGHLTPEETRNARVRLAKLAQTESFAKEIETLSRDKSLDPKNSISKLSPFLDQEGILRVGGRISNSTFHFDKKHPILLSSKHTFTKLLFRRKHELSLHAGPQHLLALVREQFWPIAGRNLARKTVQECHACFRAKPRTIQPIMGNLPSSRLNPGPPFHITGVDYAGPFSIKDRKGRGNKVTKCYVSLFICFATRAVHLELVSDLTTEAFMAALRRFVSRRGMPSRIYSDNGTNFVGASTELFSLGEFLVNKSQKLNEKIASEGISWSFIPPHSPHFGGLWEAGVKSTKHHLKRVLGCVILTFEQFYTLLVQVEAILNSRPMHPLSNDPTDLTPLTPSHFLIGRPSHAAADSNLREVPTNRLSHFQHVQQLQQHFWARWSLEYISELQQRSKWSTQHGTLKINDLVLIKDDRLPPLKWSLGRIVELHPGRDGVARVATIRTTTGLTKRSFAKICPLPTSEDNDSCDGAVFDQSG